MKWFFRCAVVLILLFLRFSPLPFQQEVLDNGYIRCFTDNYSFKFDEKMYWAGQKMFTIHLENLDVLYTGKYDLQLSYGGLNRRLPSKLELLTLWNDTTVTDALHAKYSGTSPHAKGAALWNDIEILETIPPDEDRSLYQIKAAVVSDTIVLPVKERWTEYLERYNVELNYDCVFKDSITRKIIIENEAYPSFGMVFINNNKASQFMLEGIDCLSLEIYQKNRWFGFFKPKMTYEKMKYVLESANLASLEKEGLE